MSPRPYKSALRAEQARRTRSVVLDAAERCFLRRGYAATTMKEIAAEAGVALQTVFAQGSKAAILLAAVDRGVAGGEGDEALLEQSVMQRLVAERDKAAKLQVLCELAVERTPSSGPMLRVFHAAAGGDAELAAAWEEYERRRYSDMRVLVESFAHLLRDGLDVDRATDIWWAMITDRTADMFVLGRGWTVQEYADWLVDAVDRLLLR